jgi:hypothetical protein
VLDRADVTPVFPKKTKCKPICMPESSFMHIADISESRKKKEDYQRFTLNPGNGGTKLHKQSTGGCVRLELHNIFTRLQSSILFLSNIVYSKGEHLSYSASVGKRMNAKAL